MSTEMEHSQSRQSLELSTSVNHSMGINEWNQAHSHHLLVYLLYIMNKKCPRLAASLDCPKYDKEIDIDEATRFHWICFYRPWTQSSQTNHALSFYWTVKNFYNSTGNQNRKTFFFQTQNINYKDSNGEKSAVRVAAITLLFWYKMRRENNQPTRINLLINFNSSREEPGSFISSVRGDQGSIWLEIRLVNVELKYQFHIENISLTVKSWTFSWNKK